MALDRNYSKAVSRRSVLHEMIRDYAQATSDLQRLISILQNRSDEKAKQHGSPGRSTGSKELKQACRRMSLMEEEAKRGVPLDFYLILGVKASDTTSDIKKAYRKAALRHHPDKACQFLAKTESGDEGRLWKEIADEVHKDADRLFKMIGEAYAILSDPTKVSPSSLYLVPTSTSPMPSVQASPGRDQVVSTPWSGKRAAHAKEIMTEEQLEQFLAEIDEKITESAGKLATPPPTVSSFGLASPTTVTSSANASGTTRSTPFRPVRMSPGSQKFTTL